MPKAIASGEEEVLNATAVPAPVPNVYAEFPKSVHVVPFVDFAIVFAIGVP